MMTGSVLPEGIQREFHRRTSRSWGVSFQNSMFEGTSHSRNDLKTVRLINEGRMSRATSTKPNCEEELLNTCLEISKYGTVVDYDFPGQTDYEQIELADPSVAEIDFPEMIEIGEDLVQSLLQIDENLRVSASVGAQETQVNLNNSNGFSGTYAKTAFHASLGAQYIQGQDFLRFGESRSSWTNDIDYLELKKEVIQLFKWAKDVTDIDPGTYPVIFAPGQVGNLLRPFIASLNGKAIARGISPLENKIGESLVDDRITLIDDGTIPRQISSAPFDREGIPTRRNILIDRGRPKDILTDLETAKKLGVKPSGNGTESGPAPHRTILVAGDASLESLIKNIDQGLIVFGTMGAWTGNPYGGNVSGTISLGLKIVRGEIAGRVKNCMFSINSFTHFKDNLIALTSETKTLGNATYPYVALDDVVITTG